MYTTRKPSPKLLVRLKSDDITILYIHIYIFHESRVRYGNFFPKLPGIRCFILLFYENPHRLCRINTRTHLCREMSNKLFPYEKAMRKKSVDVIRNITEGVRLQCCCCVVCAHGPWHSFSISSSDVQRKPTLPIIIYNKYTHRHCYTHIVYVCKNKTSVALFSSKKYFTRLVRRGKNSIYNTFKSGKILFRILTRTVQ